MFEKVFGKLLELTPTSLSILGVLVVVGIIGVIFIKTREVKFTTRMLVYASLCIALSFVLSYVRIMRMPQGGSLTPASMLPLILFAVIFGPVPGMLAGFAYGLLQYIQDPYMVHWAQFFLDYPLAFGCLGLAGLYRKNLMISSFLGIFGRFLMHYLTGVIFFGEYAPEGTPATIYSLIYNGSFLGLEFLLTAVILYVPQVNQAVKRFQTTIKA